MMAPDVALHDHRRLGWGTVRGADLIVDGMRALVELCSDVRLVVQHFSVSAGGFLNVMAWQGSRDGGTFEQPSVLIGAFDRQGRIAAIDRYDVDRLDEAHARYEGFTPAVPTPGIQTSATRAMSRLHEVWNSGGPGNFDALFTPGFRLHNHRRVVQLELGPEDAIAHAKLYAGMASSRHDYAVLATRGDRLALARATWEGSDDVVGASRIEWLEIVELDAGGSFVAMAVFDVEDVEAAYAELDARYNAGEAAGFVHRVAGQAFRDAFVARDWEAFTRVLTDDVVVCDHRMLGWETLHGPAAYAQALRSLVELAPDVRLRIDHVLAMAKQKVLYATSWIGTREGGAFEEPSVIVAEVDDRGRFRRFDQFDVRQLDEARAWYAAGAGRSSAATVSAPPGNAAAAAMDAVQEAFAARDWDRLRALCAEDARVEDRRHHTRVSGGREWWLGDIRLIAEEAPGASYRRTIVGTFGSHLALDHVLWTSGPGPAHGSFEIEYLWLSEVDDGGRIIAMAAIDLADRAAAVHEARERWLARDPVAAAVMRPALEFVSGMAAHDVVRIRAVLANDIVMHDHRPSRLGTIHGADPYAASLSALWELVPDLRHNADAAPLVCEPHGCVGLTHDAGTLPGGGTFETDLAVVMIVDRGRVTRLEFFDADDARAAVARLQELRPAATAGAA
jgi:ketosteroid isomerase-like protein